MIFLSPKEPLHQVRSDLVRFRFYTDLVEANLSCLLEFPTPLAQSSWVFGELPGVGWVT